MINNLNFNSLDIELTSDELNALRYVTKIVKFASDSKSFGVKLPNSWDWKPINELIDLNNKHLKYLSEYSKRRKFTQLPIYVVQLLTEFGIRKLEIIGKDHAEVLIKLHKKINSAIERSENETH